MPSDIAITKPRGFAPFGGQRIVVQQMHGVIRLQRVSGARQAVRVRDAWAAGDFSKWPGEIRVFEERRSA